MANKSPKQENENLESVTADNKTKMENKKAFGSPRIINAENPSAIPFSVVEAYKNIRVQLTSTLDKIGGKAVAISSANASEGKSTTSVNIAIILSKLNDKKVIIVDADIRRGTIHQKLKIKNDVGCLDILMGEATYEQAVKHFSPSLDVITCGKMNANSSEYFDSAEFDALLKTLKENYDYVIFDTPPVNLVSDTLVISKKCDGLLFVIRSEITTYEAFRVALSNTEKLNVNVLGVVLNAVDNNTGKYYKYKYNKNGYNRKYGYAYGYGGYGYGYGYGKKSKPKKSGNPQ